MNSPHARPTELQLPTILTLRPFSVTSPQAESQRDRETSQGQDEHVHNRALGNGAHVPRDVAQARQADRVAHGRAASEDDPRRRALLHRGPLQAGLPHRSGAEDVDTSGERWENICIFFGFYFPNP